MANSSVQTPKILSFNGSGLLLFGILLISLALALTGQVLGVPLVALIVILSLPVLVLVRVGWPNVALTILIVSSFLNGPFLYIKVFGLNLKPENVGAVAVIAVLALRIFEKRNQLRMPPAGLLLLAWVFFTAVSAANSPDPSRSLVLTLSILLSILPFLIIVITVRGRNAFDFAFNCLLLVGVLEALFGLSAWVVGHFVNDALWTFRTLDGYVNTRGTWPEMNIFGDFLVATVMLLVPNLAFQKPKWSVVFALCISLVGIFISRTRGAWLALAASILVMPAVLALVSSVNIRKMITRLLPVSIRVSFLVLAVALAILTATRTSDVLLDRILSFRNLSQDYTFVGRVNVNSTAWNAFWEGGSAILGRGAKAFQLAQYDVLGIGNDWIGNIFLGALYDGGLLGLTAFVAAIAAALWNGLAAARRTTDTRLRAKLIALVMACLAIVFTGQSNNHSWMAVVWVYFGLLVAGTNVAKEDSMVGSAQEK
jgi:O-antigen ligase